jgi:Fe-S-cluster containining protein
MDFDFTPYFKRYETLVQAADQVFAKMARDYPDCVKCKTGCSDCCYALFDLTLIEALYMHHHFNRRYTGPEKAALQEKANAADRSIAKIKREAYRRLKEGEAEQKILEDLATLRVRCPLLNDENLCDLYEVRPLTCRFYGIPTAIGGKGHSCGFSGFKPGSRYPTVNLDTIYQQLQQISSELIRDIRAKHIKLVDLLIPVSMTLIALFDDEFFGLEYKDTPSADPKT